MRIFRQIPRFGYSLMDVGTGSIIFSSGLVRDTNSSSDPTLQAFEFKNTTLFQGLQAETVWRRPTGLGLCRFTFFVYFDFVFSFCVSIDIFGDIFMIQQEHRSPQGDEALVPASVECAVFSK